MVAVLYYKDGTGTWHIADSENNGAKPDGTLKDDSDDSKVHDVNGNSQNRENSLILEASCTFPPEDGPESEVEKISIMVYSLTQKQTAVSTKPDAHFGLPED